MKVYFSNNSRLPYGGKVKDKETNSYQDGQAKEHSTGNDEISVQVLAVRLSAILRWGAT